MLNLIYAQIIILISFITYLFSYLFLNNYDTDSNFNYLGGSTNVSKIPLTKEQKVVKSKYSQYKKSSTYKTKSQLFEEFCSPRCYKIQSQQKFVGEYMRPGAKHKSILVFHKIGAGKTCLSIQIGRRWIGYDGANPLFVMPASLIPGFRAELRTPCAGDKYISAEDRLALSTLSPTSADYKNIIAASNDSIDSDFNIMSYNKFLSETTNKKKIRASIIIIDEIQNVINAAGSMGASLLKWIEANEDTPVVIMSGTPIFDSPRELTVIARYLRIDVMRDEIINPADIARLFAGKVSYFPGADPSVYPEARVKIVKKPMSGFQSRWYKSEVQNEMSKFGNLKSVVITNDFYIRSRQRANITFPNGLSGTQGLSSLTPTIIKNSLETYSCKIAAMMKKLRRIEHAFIYSAFTGPFGISAIIKVLYYNGFVDFFAAGPGKRRYAIFSGDTTMQEKDRLRAVFNSQSNDDCSQIQIVIASPAAKEGVSLFRVKQAHIIDIPWNKAKLQQILGRVIRYCSHKSLPARERFVNIYLYAAILAHEKLHTPMSSIDMYMLDIAERKSHEIEPYLEQLILCAVDRGLFQ